MKWKRSRKHQPELRGLGDLASLVAVPVAGLLDRVLGTDLRHCKGCGERRQRWNERVPFVEGRKTGRG